MMYTFMHLVGNPGFNSVWTMDGWMENSVRFVGWIKIERLFVLENSLYIGREEKDYERKNE